MIYDKEVLENNLFNHISNSRIVICDWPSFAGVPAPTCPPFSVYKYCSNKCEVLDCFSNPENSCTGNELDEPMCVCGNGFISNNGLGGKSENF